jgi:hypothetical protein
MLTKVGLQTKISNAIGFLQESREPHALLFMDIIYRRFGIEEFSGALARYDEVLASHADAPKLRVLRRIADANNPLQPDDWDHVTFPKDRVLVSALYCDRLGLPPSFGEVLRKAASQGGYALTHALLAWTWVQENGCHLELEDDFVEQMYANVGAIIDADRTIINDLKLEAAAFLCLARQSRRVDLHFVRNVIAIQNPDGGWGRPDEGAGNPDESSWHSTILALILLLHVEIPDTKKSGGTKPAA